MQKREGSGAVIRPQTIKSRVRVKNQKGRRLHSDGPCERRAQLITIVRGFQLQAKQHAAMDRADDNKQAGRESGGEAHFRRVHNSGMRRDLVAVCGQQSGVDKYRKLIVKGKEGEPEDNGDVVGRFVGKGHQHGHWV